MTRYRGNALASNLMTMNASENLGEARGMRRRRDAIAIQISAWTSKHSGLRRPSLRDVLITLDLECDCKGSFLEGSCYAQPKILRQRACEVEIVNFGVRLRVTIPSQRATD
jgi:hypothetical protein